VSWYHVFDSRLSADIYSEKYLKKVIGNAEIEDALQELDKLTQEEALMASAELLKVTHSVDDKVMGVDDRVKDVDERVQGVDDKVQGVDDKVQGVDDKVQGVHNEVQAIDNKLGQVNRSSSPKLLRSVCQRIITGHQLRDSLLRWLSPPDPSTTHNIACKSRHNGTAQWFFQGSIFNQWKSNGSFLWLYGIRASI
jgi:archaellum component FlaC